MKADPCSTSGPARSIVSARVTEALEPSVARLCSVIFMLHRQGGCLADAHVRRGPVFKLRRYAPRTQKCGMGDFPHCRSRRGTYARLQPRQAEPTLIANAAL